MAAEPSSGALPPPTLSPCCYGARARGVADGRGHAGAGRGAGAAPALAEPTTPASLRKRRSTRRFASATMIGKAFRNRFTSGGGTEMRQFVVSATGDVRCAICCGGAPFALLLDSISDENA